VAIRDAHAAVISADPTKATQGAAIAGSRIPANKDVCFSSFLSVVVAIEKVWRIFDNRVDAGFVLSVLGRRDIFLVVCFCVFAFTYFGKSSVLTSRIE